MIDVQIFKNPTAPVKSKYPYIGTLEGVVVLFTSPEFGTRLDKVNIGYSGSNWTEEFYTPLNGSITLTQ